MKDSHSVLDGIRILDFSWVLAGPYATRLLADFGAEVIKVQPPMLEAEDSFARGYYNTWNRNKLGITLNLGKPEGIALAKGLVAISDAVVENFSPRVMANWGLDYDNLKKVRPDVILLGISAMGSSGPWRDYVGFGPTVQAFSGMTRLTSYPGQPPSGIGYSHADHVAALVAVSALLGALEYRRKTGEGQYIDVSQLEAMAGLLGDAVLEYGLDGRPPEPAGSHSSEAAPCGVYRCRGDDRWCAISVFTEEEWMGFKRALGNPAWAEGERFATLVARLENGDELDRLVERWTGRRTAEEVMSRLQGQGVAAGVVQNARDLAGDPQLRERGFFIKLKHPELGTTRSDAAPIRLSQTPARYTRAAPERGQDNEYVYGQLLGLSKGEIEKFEKQGII